MAQKRSRAEVLAANVRKLSPAQKAERARKGWETRRRNTLFQGGDRENAIGEKYDFAFQAFDPNSGFLPNDFYSRVIAAADAKGSVTLSFRVAQYDTENLDREATEQILITVKRGWTEKEIRAYVYAAFRSYIKDRHQTGAKTRRDYRDRAGGISSGAREKGKSDPNAVLLVRSVSLVGSH